MSLLSIRIKDLSAFRFDAFTKLAGYPIQFGMLLALWYALARSGAALDLDYLTSYYAISFVLVSQYPFLRMALEVQRVIARGDYVRNMISGISLTKEYLAEFLVRSTWFNIISIPCAVILAHLATELTFSLPQFAGLVVLVLLGGVIQFLFWIIVGMTAFWLIVNAGLVSMFQNLQKLFTGAIVPLSMLPDAIFDVIRFTPFPYSLFYPINFYLTEDTDFIGIVTMQIGWIILLSILARFIHERGISRSAGSMV